MWRPRLALVLVVVLLTLSVLVPATTAAPPPEGVCGVCGPAFERSADAFGVDVSVVESRLTVTVTADGNSHWTAHVTVNQAAAERFDANRTLLRHVVERTYSSSRTVVDDPQNLSVLLDDRTITVTFSVGDVVHQYPGGVLLFDGFGSHPPSGNPYLGAGSLTVYGPPGTVVTHTLAGTTVDGNRVVWNAAEDDRSASLRIDRESVIVFAPDGGIVAQVTTAGAVRLHSLSRLGTGLFEYALFPAILLGVIATGLLLTGERLSEKTHLRRTTTRVIGAGVGLYFAVVAVAFFAPGDDLGVVLGIIGIGLVPQTFLTATVAVFSDSFDGDTDLTRFAAVVVLCWTLVLVLGLPVSALFVVVFGPLVFFPFGTLAGAGHRMRFGFPAVAALGAVVVTIPLVPPVGVVWVSPAMSSVVLAVSGLLGIPLFALGWQFGEGSPSDADTTDRKGRAIRPE